VIPLHGKFAHGNILGEFLGGLKSNSVDARQHGTLFVAAPITAGDTVQFKAFFGHVPGIFKVGPLTHIGKIATSIKGKGIAVSDTGINQLTGIFCFVQLARRFQVMDRFFKGLFFANKRPMFLDDGIHMPFHLFEVCFAEGGVAKIKIVIETVFNGRSESQFCFRPHLAHGRGEDMGQRMTQAVDLRLFFIGNVLKCLVHKKDSPKYPVRLRAA